jgi:hypothetical protein
MKTEVRAEGLQEVRAEVAGGSNTRAEVRAEGDAYVSFSLCLSDR